MKYFALLVLFLFSVSAHTANTITEEQRMCIVEKILASVNEQDRELFMKIINSRSTNEDLDALVKRFGYNNEMYYDSMINSSHLNAIWQLLAGAGVVCALYLAVCFLQNDFAAEKLKKRNKNVKQCLERRKKIFSDDQRAGDFARELKAAINAEARKQRVNE